MEDISRENKMKVTIKFVNGIDDPINRKIDNRERRKKENKKKEGD